MTPELQRALLDAVRAAPDDDGPRRVWADALLEHGNGWGELVNLQCDLARGDGTREERIARRRREAQLLALHGGTWAGHVQDVAEGWTFRRGFVDEVAVDARRFAARGAELWAAAPLLRGVWLTGLEGFEDQTLTSGRERIAPEVVLAWARDALESERMTQLTGLGLQVRSLIARDSDQVPAFYASHADDLVPDLLAAAPRLARLRALAVRGLSSQGVSALLDGPLAAQLLRLDLSGSDYSARALNKLLAASRPPSLRELELGPLAGSELLELLAQPGARALRTLRVGVRGGDWPEYVEALQSPGLSSVRRLGLGRYPWFPPEVVEAIGASPALAQLEELDLSGVRVSTLGALAKAPRLGRLRVLRMREAFTTSDQAKQLLKWPLVHRLEVLDLRRSDGPLALSDELQHNLDGVVLTSPGYSEAAEPPRVFAED